MSYEVLSCAFCNQENVLDETRAHARRDFAGGEESTCIGRRERHGHINRSLKVFRLCQVFQ